MLIRKTFLLILPIVLLLASCKDDPNENCPSEEQIESRFTQPSGEEVIITKDGKLFRVFSDGCQYVADYYNDDFRSENYSEIDGTISIITPEGNIPVVEEFFEDFEDYEDFLSIFFSTIQEAGEKVWGYMTLQSPAAKTVEEYVALRQCIMDGTCDFIDHKIELVEDPKDADNQCLRFETVDKTDDMVTGKSSIRTPLLFFENGDDFWFSADFLIQGNIPTTLADFENEFFEGTPGPRILISNNKLAIENKFGNKEVYRHSRDITVPTDEWFNVKVHLNYSPESDGLVELWQDDVQLISANGVTLPLINSIQNSLEIGISASELATTLFVDNVRVDHESF